MANLRTSQSASTTSAAYDVENLPRRVVKLLAKDTSEWGLTTRAAVLIALMPLLATIVFVATIPFPSLYHLLTEEDMVLEWGQFFLIFAASILFALSGVRLFRSGRRGLGLLYLMIALGTFFVAGEEIAWGQRLFGWGTPEALEEVNAQQETTIHNISSLHLAFIYGVALVGLYGVVAPLVWLVARRGRAAAGPAFLFVPPLCLIPAFFMTFGFRVSRLVFESERLFPSLSFAIIKFSEVTELCLYFALLVFAWLVLRRLANPQALQSK